MTVKQALQLVRVGALMGPHGLRGMVKAKLELDDPQLVISGGPLHAEDGRSWTVKVVQQAGQGAWALALQGVDTVDAAQALRGTVLFLDRSGWPEDDNEVYLADYMGTEVRDANGTVVGVVNGIVDLPAGPALDIGGKLVPVEEDFMEMGEAVVLTALGLELLAV